MRPQESLVLLSNARWNKSKIFRRPHIFAVIDMGFIPTPLLESTFKASVYNTEKRKGKRKNINGVIGVLSRGGGAIFNDNKRKHGRLKFSCSMR